MKHSNAELLRSLRIVPPDSLLKFGYSPNGGIEFDSASDVLSFSYSGTPKVDIGEPGLIIRDGNGIVVGHPTQIPVLGIQTELQIHGTAAPDSGFSMAAWRANTGAPFISLGKSRSASIGDFAIVEDDDPVGYIRGVADDGTDLATEIAEFRFEVDDASPAEDAVGGAIVLYTSEPNGAQTEAVRIRSSQDVEIANGSVLIGETSNVNMTVGLTINQGASDDQILAFKSSDIATGLSSATAQSVEPDDFFVVDKAENLQGGVKFVALSTDGTNNDIFQFHSYGGTAHTNKTTGGKGLFEFTAYEHDGSNGLSNITADGNVFAIRAQVGGGVLTRFLIDEDGDMYSVTAGQTFDDYDDMALIETYDMARSGSLKGQIKAEFGRAMLMDESTLIEAGVLGGRISDGGLTNQSQLSRVLTGGVRQLNQKHMSLVERVESMSLELESANKQLAVLTAPESL